MSSKTMLVCPLGANNWSSVEYSSVEPLGLNLLAYGALHPWMAVLHALAGSGLNAPGVVGKMSAPVGAGNKAMPVTYAEPDASTATDWAVPAPRKTMYRTAVASGFNFTTKERNVLPGPTMPPPGVGKVAADVAPAM